MPCLGIVFSGCRQPDSKLLPTPVVQSNFPYTGIASGSGSPWFNREIEKKMVTLDREFQKTQELLLLVKRSKGELENQERDIWTCMSTSLTANLFTMQKSKTVTSLDVNVFLLLIRPSWALVKSQSSLGCGDKHRQAPVSFACRKAATALDFVRPVDSPLPHVIHPCLKV